MVRTLGTKTRLILLTLGARGQAGHVTLCALRDSGSAMLTGLLQAPGDRRDLTLAIPSFLSVCGLAGLSAPSSTSLVQTIAPPSSYIFVLKSPSTSTCCLAHRHILSLAVSSELCPCRVRRDSAVRASAEEWQRGQSSPLSDHTPVLTFPTSLSSYLPDLQKTCHPAMPGSLSTLSMRASRTEASPNRDR